MLARDAYPYRKRPSHYLSHSGHEAARATEQEDRDLEQELLNDPKEIAEHNMLVDLSRNDLGKISEIGSVEVRKNLAVERYSCNAPYQHGGGQAKKIVIFGRSGRGAAPRALCRARPR